MVIRNERSLIANERTHVLEIKVRRITQLLAVILAILFLISAALNLGLKIPLGFGTLSFSSPSSTIAEFEIVIGVVLAAAAAISWLYLLGGAYLLAIAGVVEGLLSSGVQGLARSMHEAMVPFAVAGCILLAVDAHA
ncbi:MAG TPA: hypothetical protein VFF30_02165 [Nitrososphaerales archaeon]|nr:hypothetical protein [Nitrososphaerales archaeon]